MGGIGRVRDFEVGGVFGGVEGSETASIVGYIASGFIDPIIRIVLAGIDSEGFVVVRTRDRQTDRDILRESDWGIENADLDCPFTGADRLLDGIGDVLGGEGGEIEVAISGFRDFGRFGNGEGGIGGN